MKEKESSGSASISARRESTESKLTLHDLLVLSGYSDRLLPPQDSVLELPLDVVGQLEILAMTKEVRSLGEWEGERRREGEGEGLCGGG